VTVIEVREMLRQWLMGVAKARIALNTGADRKTVRRYVATAEREGLSVERGPEALTDELVIGAWSCDSSVSCRTSRAGVVRGTRGAGHAMAMRRSRGRRTRVGVVQ
jgi:hypothetical protein